MEKFDHIISHRGYHKVGIIENTLEAFSESLKYSLPIELDVYLTRDGKMVVFHDSSLKRLMGVDKKVEDCTYEELMSYSFLEGRGKIPLLREVLDLIQGKVWLLIEVKRCSSYRKTCEKLLEELRSYSGKVRIQSFDFRIVSWFLKRKMYSTGLLVSPEPKVQNYFYYRLVNCPFFLLHVLKPDFVSYDIRGVPSSLIHTLKNRKMPLYFWTIRTKEELKLAKQYGEYFIAEGLGSFR